MKPSRLRALPLDPATFWKRWTKTFELFCDSPLNYKPALRHTERTVRAEPVF